MSGESLSFELGPVEIKDLDKLEDQMKALDVLLVTEGQNYDHC